MKNPQGAWGPYGGKGLAFRPYGWAQVNGDGTIAASSGNLTLLHEGTGNYRITPSDNLVSEQVLADAINSEGVPFLCSATYIVIAGVPSIRVSSYNSTSQALVDGPFWVKVWTTN